MTAPTKNRADLGPADVIALQTGLFVCLAPLNQAADSALGFFQKYGEPEGTVSVLKLTGATYAVHDLPLSAEQRAQIDFE